MPAVIDGSHGAVSSYISAHIPGPSSLVPISPTLTLPTCCVPLQAPPSNTNLDLRNFTQSSDTSIPIITSSITFLDHTTDTSNLGTQNIRLAARTDIVCIGHDLDVTSLGVISTLVVPTAIGLSLWVLFATIRPRYRQVYGLREWFVQQELRPKTLSQSFWAFLTPPVPLIPPIPDDMAHAGKSAAKDAELFPSDEELSQRTLWTCFTIVAGWTILALGGFLPLYMVSMPCLAETSPPAVFAGSLSLLQDLSVLRLLQVLDPGSVSTTNASALLSPREIVNGTDLAPPARTRVIIATALAIALGVLPALWKLIHEFNELVAYRERWVDVRCQGQEMAWLSARRAPGFVGWGEKRLKDFLLKSGLSASLEAENRNPRSRRRRRAQDWSDPEKAKHEIDVQSLFSIGDTMQLAILIDERDQILENLEIAETKYIQSFRLSTPDPSIADWVPPLPPAVEEEPGSPTKPQISRPRPLAGSTRRRRRGRNPAFGSSSLPPTSYVMPSQYYKLRGVEGLNGGHFTDSDQGSITHHRGPSLTDSINQRVIGSRFQEVNRNTAAYESVPLGSPIIVDEAGRLRPMDSPIPDPGLYGPNQHSSWDTAAFSEGLPQNQWIMRQFHEPIAEEPEEDWVDVMHEDPEAFQHAEEYPSNTRTRPRPPRTKTAPQEQRETFPLRNRNGPTTAEEVTPPHLRLQPRQPFVRPLSGLDHDALGVIYADINLWRSKLKAVNVEIADAQRESYNDIADGARIKGWLMVGRGLRFIPNIQLIEGRAKEDIRWDELQNEGTFIRSLAFWAIISMIAIVLGFALTAVAGLALGTAPDFTHYLTFLGGLSDTNQLAAGVATCFAPALAATLFISIALLTVNYIGPFNTSISLSASRAVVFKSTFYIFTLIAGVWLFTAGSILFALHAFEVGLGETETIANGLIYMGPFALSLVLMVWFTFPALLLLQPMRLWRVTMMEQDAITSRQRFRAVYPRTYNPSYGLGCCIFAFLLAASFAFIFPLVVPAVLVLIFLTLIAHRFVIGYVYGRTHSQTGGLLQIWIHQRLGTLLAFQPLLLGLIFLTRDLWIEGGVLCGVALLVVILVESYCSWRTRAPSRKSLSPITLDALDTFLSAAQPTQQRDLEEESTSLVSSARNTRLRGSFASVLEMMSLTLAVAPSPSEIRGPVPLETETLDDLTATERAARTHPDAPPHLPPLPFADHAEEMGGILYAPELLAPPPVIWLPNDAGGVGRSEAFDLERYHGLKVTLDVRVKDDVLPRRSSSSHDNGRRNAL